MGLARVRWLLVAIDQTASGILNFFWDWRAHRLKIRPSLGPSDLRQYYRTEDFRTDFVAFVRAQKVGRAPAVKALLDYEDALRSSSISDSRFVPDGYQLTAGTALQPDDVPARKDRTLVFELSHDIQRVVDALKVGKQPIRSPGARFYVTRPVSAAKARIDQISDWLAYLLRLCDGHRNVESIVKQLSSQLPEVQKSLRRHVCMRLLEGAQAQELIDVYRIAYSATPAACETSETLAARYRPAS